MDTLGIRYGELVTGDYIIEPESRWHMYVANLDWHSVPNRVLVRGIAAAPADEHGDIECRLVGLKVLPDGDVWWPDEEAELERPGFERDALLTEAGAREWAARFPAVAHWLRPSNENTTDTRDIPDWWRESPHNIGAMGESLIEEFHIKK